jgi:hypothetical protein
MFKKFFILVISFYQNFLSYFLKTLLGVTATCRYETTCSQYAKDSIRDHGAVRGGIMSIKRLLSCQPFYKRGEVLA